MGQEKGLKHLSLLTVNKSEGSDFDQVQLMTLRNLMTTQCNNINQL